MLDIYQILDVHAKGKVQWRRNNFTIKEIQAQHSLAKSVNGVSQSATYVSTKGLILDPNVHFHFRK